MFNWTNKQWGALLGILVVLAVSLVGVGITALAVLAGIGGYFVGKFLDGELDLEEIQARAQAGARGETYEPAVDGASATTPPANGPTQPQATPQASPMGGPSGSRVR